MRTGNYDGVSASGDATLRLIAAGDVAPVNTDLLENYDGVFEGLKNKPHNSVDGQMYGVPHGRGANLLMWRTDKVKPAPTSWSVVWEANSPVQGEDHGVRQPDLHRGRRPLSDEDPARSRDQNPYELDEDQFQAAVDLLKQQRANIGEYWSDCGEGDPGLPERRTVVGTTWQYQANVLAGEKAPVDDDASRGRLDRVVGHLDDLVEGEASELHVPLDGSHHLAGGEREGDRVLRRGPVQQGGVRTHRGQEPLQDLPRRGRGLLQADLVLDDSGGRLR